MDDLDASASDALVIERSLDDPDAFRVIFDRHFASVHRFLARRSGRDVADELASEVLLVAFERRVRFDLRVANARPWLLGIAVNVARRHFRRDRVRTDAAIREAALREPGESAEHEVERRDEQRRLRGAVLDALSTLSAKERDAVLLHCWEGLSYEEVAAALAVPLGTVKSRISRGRAHLQSRLAITVASPVDAAEEASHA